MKKILVICLTVLISFSSFSQTKKVLCEEFTTTRCGFCPQKSIDLHHFTVQNPNVIAVTHHSGFGKDGMTNQTNLDLSSVFYPFAAPSMTIDRNMYDGESHVGIKMKVFAYEDTILSILATEKPEVEIDISKNYEASTRTISGNITINFIETPSPGDFRISVYIIEDSVVGDTGNYQYDQKNYITNDPSYPILYNQTLIEGFQHLNVVRAAPLGTWGDEADIPDNPIKGSSYSKSFSYVIPQKYDTEKGFDVDLDQIKLLAFVSYYDADVTKRQVLNAEIEKMLSPSSGINQNYQTTDMKFYPNPTHSNIYLDLKSSKNEVSNILLTDISGKVIYQKSYVFEKGQQQLKIDISDFTPGIYFLNFQCGDQTITEKVMKF
jgi:hypothetical protein